MIHRYYGRIISAIRRGLGNDWIGRLDLVENEIRKCEQKAAHKRLRVLIGPSFAIYPPSFALDRLLSYALRLRGVDVIPIYCDSIQRIECNYFGGDWGGKQNFSRNCETCKKTSERLWRLHPNKVIPLSKYISPVDADQIAATVARLNYEEVAEFEEDGILYGKFARDILVNNYLVGNPALVEGHEFLLKVQLQNLLLISRAYERALDEQKPDRVISNDSYYGMWAILERQCRKRNIPFYSHWPVTKNRIAFAYNDAAMNLNFAKSWPEFSRMPLTYDDENKIEKWLTGERGYIIDTTKLSGYEREDPVLLSIDPSRPTLILAANVIWDLAALNKQIIFKDMVDWILQTIKWFHANLDFQLIIRPHPAETSPLIPRTRETVSSAIELSGMELPENVFLLRPDAKVTFNQLMSRYNVRGVAVHTTTVGFEYPARGVPVVTTGRSPYRGFGFTIDPESKSEYYARIEEILRSDKKWIPKSDQQLAKKFIKFYQFHYYSSMGLFSGNPFFDDSIRISEDLMRILSSNDAAFGYVINAIVEGGPINGVDRWIPAS